MRAPQRRRVADNPGMSPWTSRALVRSELFSIERLEQHAESLAEAQPVAGAGGRADTLARRIADNYQILVSAHRQMVDASADGQPITPAAQWLTDNFHVVEAQITGIRQDFPAGYYRQLPKLATGPFVGYPRVMGIAWAFVAHTDSHFDPVTLCRFVAAYQRVQPLSIGELWALPITLRIVLIENLRRAAKFIMENRAQRQQANVLADAILGAGGRDPEPLSDVLPRMPNGQPPPTFAVQLIKRLQDQSTAVAPALVWLEERLAGMGSTADDIVREVHQDQAAMTVTVRNVITSMRMISEADWTVLFETVSQVDELLRQGSAFARMDFATRDAYRRAIEELARGSGLSELDVTREVLRTAHAVPHVGREDPISAARQADPGYYLIGGGREAMEEAIGFRPSILTWLRRVTIGQGVRGYAGAIALVTLLLTVIVLWLLADRGLGSVGIIVFAALSLFPAADAAVALVNRLITSWLRPVALPALELLGGIPADLRTVIVVPTLLTTRQAIEEQIERLEIHHLTSPDGAVTCALLSDWTDSLTETAPGDAALLDAAAEGVSRLNRLYQTQDEPPPFLLLHRRRVWNASEEKWMGWERKRGKLHELNRLLRGATGTNFIPVGGQPVVAPEGVRYVVTLDSDTRLPREAVRRLIGKMAHPLNRPRIDARIRRVVEGNGILQPRVTPSLPVGAEASVFQYAFSSAGGIDPYAAAVSDVYQDLFHEGSYAGKGIYDVDVFEQVLEGVVPDNTMLSHDLFEGILARAGFASDIEVVEEFPARYDIAASRQHRWARGDWQLLPWIVGRAHAAIPLTGLWKMLDNLRRGLTPPLTVVALLAGWLLPFNQALAWTVFVLLTLMVPALLPIIVTIVPVRRDITLASHARAVAADAGIAGTQIALIVTLLAEQAALMTDAIARTLTRVFVTHRHLLEWTTSEQVRSRASRDLPGYYRRLPGTLVIAAAAMAVAIFSPPLVWLLAAPMALLWFAAPAVAWWASQSPHHADSAPVTAEDAAALRLVARRTWHFFETFVTAGDNMLPPDNFQEDPRPVIAHRTSPTNIGLYLLSVVAARDFGWIGLAGAIDRLEATFATLDRMERVRGHFLNWYDTSDLRPLDPKYISSVDSGNLAGHLITLANACEAWSAAPLIGSAAYTGIGDALLIARQSLDRLRGGALAATTAAVGLRDALATVQQSLAARLPLRELLAKVEAVVVAARTLHAAEDAPDTATLVMWAEAMSASTAAHLRDQELLPAQKPVPAGGHGLAALSSEPGGGGQQSQARELRQRLLAMANRARVMADEMRFDFLLDPARKLLSIGFRVSDGQLDQSSYDLLASEARLASFLAIANGDTPVSHWFRLGRSVTTIHHAAALISWSGSMFEYLMPSLVMRSPTGSLLATTNRLVVRRQIEYGEQLGIGWGMSESAYNTRDLEMTYQYSNFGIPDLALKRGLGQNAVLAPYATALAAMVDPAAAMRNLTRLEAAGGLGVHGFYEALDYTTARVPEGQNVAIVRAYMAHHQGMTIVAIANTVLDGIIRTRFHTEPKVQATELLLEERSPRRLVTTPEHVEDAPRITPVGEYDHSTSRRLSSPHGIVPATHLLSNGNYSVMITAAGSGYSRWQGRAITRWREDGTSDDWGSFIYLRDVETDIVWSAGYQPTGREADSYNIIFAEERAELSRRDGTLRTTLEVTVSGEDDAEVRRVSIANEGAVAREIELTSYMELVLARPADDNAHPAFSKMFVQTEFDAGLGIVIATRRRRAPSEPEIWAAHLVVVEGETIGDLHFETDRAVFLERGRSPRDPASVTGGRALSGMTGTVLDPIFSLRRRVRIAPGATARLAFWTIAAGSRADLMALADKHHDRAAYDRAVTLAWTQARVQLNHLGLGPNDAGNFQRLAGHLLYVNALFRPPPDVLRAGGAGPAAMWASGISGDLPILLLRIDDVEDIDGVRELLLAHEYWRMKQLAVDLVILNEKGASYNQDLQIAIDAAVRMSQTRLALAGTPLQGNVFVLRSDLITPEAKALLLSVSRVVFVSQRGSLADQLERLEDRNVTARAQRALPPANPVRGWAVPELEFFNGWGGFAENGREYVTILRPGETTPAPWTNVIANPEFGFQVTAEGGGYSWWRNSRENQLTPWSNDPVGDRSGDVLYVRDEDSGALWGPAAQPVRQASGHFDVHHGMGYSRFRSLSYEIELDLVQFVPLDDPIKISRLTLRNRSARARRLSVTAYVEWVLGPSRAGSLATLVTEYDSSLGAVLARNPWNTSFGPYVAFAAIPGRDVNVTGDRREFIGRHGSTGSPAALARGEKLSGRVGAGLDPCAALRTAVDLRPGESVEVVVLLGAAQSVEDARRLIRRHGAGDPEAVLTTIKEYWLKVTSAVVVGTPDRAMDIMLNGWLLYQTLACRVWARAGFYQASGAFGFRDQLQDGMALAVALPEFTRAHLLRAAARQFPEGDMQHWWLPPAGQGVRTRISDDRVWLAYTTHQYVQTTGDNAVLDELVPFVTGPILGEHEHEAYFQPGISETKASLFEHCALGLDHALVTGTHGLPLFGTGDWNDGMSRVGEAGQGESVWLGWFLYTTLLAFAPVAEARGERDRAASWRDHAAHLRIALAEQAWDGAWYRRGYFDDGTPLGSSASSECRIDAIAQSWSVISEGSDPAREARAMAAMEEQLIRRHDRLALLFTPPFDRTSLDPGYIKGYPPGLRENGGQYTHAAIWSVIAFAKLGDGDKAAELFSMLNPINHALNSADAYRYKVEPYVIAADIYAASGHVGRGGWTWYTGSAGWMYRAGVESILGLRHEGATLLIDPRVPRSWRRFEMRVRHGETHYEINVENPHGVCAGAAEAWLDDREIVDRPVRIHMMDDGARHLVRLVLGDWAGPILSGTGVDPHLAERLH